MNSAKEDGGNFHQGKYETFNKKDISGGTKKQAENITNLISGNFKLTMQEIHGLKNEINDHLRKSLEFMQNNLEEKVDNKLKRQNIFINNDFSKAMLELRKEGWGKKAKGTR